MDARRGPGLALVEVEGPADELALEHPEGVELRWLHRGDAVPGTLLLDALRASTCRPGRSSSSRTASAGMKEARVVLHDTWGLDRAAALALAYWALGRDEDRFQAEKREPVGAHLRRLTLGKLSR